MLWAERSFCIEGNDRHNEKNIDKLNRDLKDFRAETLKQFEKVDDRFNQLEIKVDQRFAKIDERFDKVNDRFNQITMLLVAIVGLIVATIVKLVFLS